MVRSTAKTDRYHNWRARDARRGCDATTNKALDDYHRHIATKYPWEFWFMFGDEVV